MNEHSPSPQSLVKIGELAKATGVSVSTLKFYAKEGLIAPACKTGRNMAWYDPACAATIRTIRKLQKERYYPLSVIKRLLESTGRSEPELELLDAIHKVDYRSDRSLTSLGEAVRRTRLTAAQIARLSDEGLISPTEEGRRTAYSAADISVMELIRRRMDAGIPFEQSLLAFGIYARALREAAGADVAAFISGAVLTPGFTAETGARMIRVSDETLDAFVDIKREEFNRLHGSGSLEDLYRFQRALTRGLERICPALDAAGLHREAALCADALAGKATGIPRLDEAAGKYHSFTPDAGSGIAGSVAGCAASREYFAALEPEAEGALPVYCMKLCWLSLAPDILACGELARQTREDLGRFLRIHVPEQADSLRESLLRILAETGEVYEHI